MAQLLDGKALAKRIREELKEKITAFGICPRLTVVVVGEDPASAVYVRNKERACREVGIDSVVIRLDENTNQEELERVVRELNNDPATHGILVQLPLPGQLDENRIIRLIAPEKDVDGFHPVNAGALLTGQEGFVPCTPKGILRLIRESGMDLTGKRAVVIGRSNTVGKPAALLLLRENATVTVAHSRTENLKDICRAADVLVAAVGRPGTVTADMVKPGAVVIDVGINRTEQGLVGDVDFEGVQEIAGAITPVPGGVGPMTVAMLLENTYLGAMRACGKA